MKRKAPKTSNELKTAQIFSGYAVVITEGKNQRTYFFDQPHIQKIFAAKAKNNLMKHGYKPGQDFKITTAIATQEESPNLH